MDWLNKADISKIQLLASNDGIKLYKDFGFKENPTILEMVLE